ncbi:predicted protein [Arabidopsis lyrata subsp. lyrata]|uniref:Predicted protein n=1 Tax=Arabidopsis lyrata subsp. lyrata TaxID=81972 RepID=D7LB69_ARALL|nr:predicted protein [Arabidopsis lyrata subsp. lyrata]
MKKGKVANEGKMRESKSKKRKLGAKNEVRSLKEEDLLLDSDYEGDSLSGSLNSGDFYSKDDGSKLEGIMLSMV